MKYNLILFAALFCTLIPLSTHAADFIGLVGIPGIEPSGDTDLNVYINALYRLSISIAALLAVIKIVIAGAKYMLTDIVPAKEDAKKDIQGALIGLLIVIGAIIILNTVNSDLTNLDLTINQIDVEQGPTIQEVLAERARVMEDKAEELGSAVVTINCESSVFGINEFDMLPGEDEEQACRRVCTGSTLRGEFIDDWWGDQCRYIDAVGAQCVPDSNRTCCEGIHRATWNPGTPGTTPPSCTGVAAARDGIKLECGQLKRVWNETGGYCSAATCNLNTDANCCAAAGKTITDGVCSATESDITTEQDCNDRGEGWAYIGGTCRPQSIETTDIQELPTPRPVDPYTYCFRITPQDTWEFNESADRCQKKN